MDLRISRFLRHHHVLTLSTVSSLGSWTSHCFYAIMPDKESLVFTTGPETRHGREMLENQNVSGGIMLETNVIGKIQGIQFTGRALPVNAEGEPADDPAQGSACRRAYLKRFPFALAASLDLWILHVDYIKMTDNRLGFGKKLEWRRAGETEPVG